MRIRLLCIYKLTLTFIALSASTLYAHEHNPPTVVPQAERDIAQQKQMPGPTQNQGISSVVKLGTVPLAGEFSDPAKHMLRSREITLAPGGIVAVHQHEGRPGMAYILEGEAIEHRNDTNEPIVRGPGAVAFEKTGVIHWWENKSDKPMRALVVDIVPVE